MAEELYLDVKTNIGQVTKDTKDYKKSLEQVNEEINLQTKYIIAQEKELIKLKAKQDAIPKGGWVAGMDKLNDKIKETTADLNLEKNALKGLQQEQKEATKEVKKHKDAQKENNKESKESIADFKVMGVSLNGVKKGFAKVIPTAKAMFGTIKAGMISTGIGALVVGVMALIQSFKRSEAGQEKFQKIMAMIGAVTSQVLDLFADLGETIIEAVTSPMKALESLGNGIVKFFKDPIGAARDLVVKTTIAVKDFVDETQKEVAVLGEVTKARQKAHHIDRELKVERAEANRKINDIRLQAEDREKNSARERIELLRKAQKIEEDITKKEIKSKQLLIDAQILEMEQGLNTIESKDKLAQLQAEAIDLDTKRLRSQRLLQTQITTALNEEKAARIDMTKIFVDQVDERIDAIDKLAKAENRALHNYLKSNDKRKQTDKEVQDAKTNITKDGFRLAQELAKEGTALSKGIAIAEVTASGVEGVQNAYTTAQKSPYTLINPAYPFIQAGLAGAFSAVQLAKIISGSPAGGGGGGGGSSAVPSTPAPQMMSGAFDISGGVVPEPTRAYVVTDEMTNSQNQLANIRRRSTI
jgi:hypothetical protein